MDRVILSMLDKYHCQTDDDFENALKQIIQQIVLLGLWRAKFFEHAAFYGGTALRILYQLDRFSEDLDFSLLKDDDGFTLEPYFQAIKNELKAFGFEVDIERKMKQVSLAIESAFLKANTKEHLLKVKLEVDASPPLNFSTEAKPLLQPIPFWVKSYTLPDLFAGKISAALCRGWQTRVKGRDWYDFLWFVQQDVPVSLRHLETRLRAVDFYREPESLTLGRLQALLVKRIDSLDIELAKRDIAKFIKDTGRLDGWSREIFLVATDAIRVV